MLPETKTEILSWRRWPLAEGGKAGWLKAGLVALLAAGLWLVLLLSLPPFAALLLGATFSTLLLPYYLPATYQIGPEGVRIQRGIFPTRLKPWPNFASLKLAEHGYWLIPANLPPARNLEPLRALFLPYPLDPTLKANLANDLSQYLPFYSPQRQGDTENT